MINRRTQIAAALAIALGAFGGAAQAGLVIEGGKFGPIAGDSPKYVVPSERADGKVPLDIDFLLGVRPGEQTRVTQNGMAAHRMAAHIKGFGKDVRLIEALSQIIPQGWQVFLEGQAGLQQQVSWEGDRNWVSTLNSVLNQASRSHESASAFIDWAAQEVHLKWDVTAPAPIVAQAGGETGSHETPQPAAGPLFRLDADKTLSENLIEWAGREGWQMIWHAPVDYRVSAPRIYHGELAAEGGALEQVVRDYFEASYPLRVRLHDNLQLIEVFSATR